MIDRNLKLSKHHDYTPIILEIEPAAEGVLV